MSSTASPSSPATVLVVVGNPKPASRTRFVGESVAQRLVDELTEAGTPAEVLTLEVADLGVELLGWGSAQVAEAVDGMCTAAAIVVATPVFKGTYTGLLKLLFDQISAGQLGGTPVVPVMVGAAPNHAMAVDCHLRPLLVEVGASCPTAGLYILDSSLDTLDDQLDAWAEVWLPGLARLIEAPTPSGVG